MAIPAQTHVWGGWANWGMWYKRFSRHYRTANKLAPPNLAQKGEKGGGRRRDGKGVVGNIKNQPFLLDIAVSMAATHFF